MSGFIFVGERPSRKAKSRNWTWEDGQLAAKPLFEATVLSAEQGRDREMMARPSYSIVGRV